MAEAEIPKNVARRRRRDEAKEMASKGPPKKASKKNNSSEEEEEEAIRIRIEDSPTKDQIKSSRNRKNNSRSPSACIAEYAQ